ncbi:MAG TPA: carboxypeptidase-like regulatory domain-containing protein [Vicinamibacterales bacterium]|nr:carboxypeptidase-like regulatory domain-containing protein [Vicinamibacterales bacterium]
MLPAFRRLLVSTLIAVIVLPAGLLEAAPISGVRAAVGTISGSARSASGQLLPSVAVRVRNVQTGQLEGAVNAGSDGQFSFSALGPGLYTVEIVNAAGQVLSTSAPVLLTATATSATGVTATTSAAAQAGGAGGSFWTSAWGIVSIAAIGAGVVGIVVAANSGNASGSQ